ncbi:MAG TPA: hypothetical protein VF092_12265 [Longimicrobium sp.]
MREVEVEEDQVGPRRAARASIIIGYASASAPSDLHRAVTSSRGSSASAGWSST